MKNQHQNLMYLIIALLFSISLFAGNNPTRLYVHDEFANSYSLDTETLRLEKRSSTNEILEDYFPQSGGLTLYSDPVALQYSPPNQLYILDGEQKILFEFDRYLNFTSQQALPEELVSPVYFLILQDKQLIIYDEFDQILYTLYPNSPVLTPFGGDLISTASPLKQMLKSEGKILLSFNNMNRINILNSFGQNLKTIYLPKSLMESRILYFDDSFLYASTGKSLFIYNYHTQDIKEKKLSYTPAYIFSINNTIFVIDSHKTTHFLEK